MKFTRQELQDLATAWIVLGLCFSMQYLFGRLSSFPIMLGVALIAVGSAFIVHELAHKYLAQRYGYFAEFRLWRKGIIIAFASALLSMGSFIFAAPGAVYIMAYTRPRENGIISLSGPVSNIILAALFYFLIPADGLLGVIGYAGFRINLWLAAFNLLPIPPLDGRAILSWNMKVWIILIVIAWGGMALLFLGLLPLGF